MDCDKTLVISHLDALNELIPDSEILLKEVCKYFKWTHDNAIVRRNRAQELKQYCRTIYNDLLNHKNITKPPPNKESREKFIKWMVENNIELPQIFKEIRTYSGTNYETIYNKKIQKKSRKKSRKKINCSIKYFYMPDQSNTDMCHEPINYDEDTVSYDGETDSASQILLKLADVKRNE